MKQLTKSKTIVSIVLTIIVCNFIIFAYPGGESGYTMKSGNSGCSCHGGKDATISVVIAGLATLAPSQSANYTVTISNGTGKGVGVDIATSAGTLANTDANLKVIGTELTQPSAKSFSSGSYVFTFKYTAPATTGAQTIYATGCSSKPQWNFATNFTVTVAPASDVKSDNIKPADFKLTQNFPNPFNPTTKIQFNMPVNSFVTLRVFDIMGREVKTLISEDRTAGRHSVDFNAAYLSSGIYICQINTGSYTQAIKMILTK